MTQRDDSSRFASRAGAKLEHALNAFSLSLQGWTCADIGSNAGGFVDCLLQRGAAKVYAIERGYGVLDYRLRRDARVVVLERTDALQVRLPQRVRLVTIDAGWTRQQAILPAAIRLLDPDGMIITLIKPHYEADEHMLEKGVLREESLQEVLSGVAAKIEGLGLACTKQTESPIRGRAGNREFLWLVKPLAESGE
ncbi:MAG TPA: SAM-dependent methyltransferase [Phycisphaerae bacterium]|nr:SAM-dependent methyltransferase [Phycisphaerae bacterium]